MLTDWNPKLETGHDDIDAQHRELLERFKSFSDACRGGKGKQEIVELYNFLENYVVEHFTAEENLMNASSYPNLMSHRLEHQEFVTRVSNLKYEIQNDRITLPLIIETSENLLRWVIGHIHKTDVKMAEYLKSQSE